MYRPKGYKDMERRKQKSIKKRSWYKPFSTVLFCPPTPNSELAKELRKIVAEETADRGWSVKVIERAGVKLQYQIPGLKEPSDCGKEDCFLHTTGGKGNCRKEGLVYKGTCITCMDKGPSSEVDREGKVRRLEGERRGNVKSLYWGESSFGAYVRGLQHMKALEKPRSHQENAFFRHREDFHLGEEGDVQFKLELIRNFSKPMGRLVCEGCNISTEADICMNGKLDHFRPGVGKVVVSNLIHTGRRRNKNTG